MAASARAAAHRSFEANLALLQGSVNAWMEFHMAFITIPYYWERSERAAARSSQGSIEESKFLRAASTVIGDHAEVLRELSNSE
jgi:hypothetical protein